MAKPSSTAPSDRRTAAVHRAEDHLEALEDTRGSIPSTLDPDFVEEAGAIGNLADEIDMNEGAGHGLDDSVPPGGEELPEEALARQVEDAAEAMPTDTPADRADQSDQRDEVQPRRRGGDLDA